jgi:hypothetical protein
VGVGLILWVWVCVSVCVLVWVWFWVWVWVWFVCVWVVSLQRRLVRVRPAQIAVACVIVCYSPPSDFFFHFLLIPPTC